MPYYALINGRHTTPALESIESIKGVVDKGLNNRRWPQGDAMDGKTDMIEIYDMKIKSNGTRDLVEKYFWKGGEVIHSDNCKVGTHAIKYMMMGDVSDPEKLFVDITMIKDPKTPTDDGSFVMNFESEDGDEDGDEKMITRVHDHRMFNIIIDAVSRDFLDNHLDGMNILKLEYGVHGQSFMDEDTYVQGWIYDREGNLIEQHGYPRKGW